MSPLPGLVRPHRFITVSIRLLLIRRVGQGSTGVRNVAGAAWRETTARAQTHPTPRRGSIHPRTGAGRDWCTVQPRAGPTWTSFGRGKSRIDGHQNACTRRIWLLPPSRITPPTFEYALTRSLSLLSFPPLSFVSIRFHHSITPFYTAPPPINPTQQMTASREDSVYLAKLAEQAERYEGAYKKTRPSDANLALTLCLQRWSRT